MRDRLRTLAVRCRKRGGDCPCNDSCQAIRELENEIECLGRRKREIDDEIHDCELALRRLNTPMATLKNGFKFREGLTPVMVFDVDEATFGYEDDDGEWVESDEWPFNEGYIWWDDCKRYGIQVE